MTANPFAHITDPAARAAAQQAWLDDWSAACRARAAAAPDQPTLADLAGSKTARRMKAGALL